MNVRMACNEGTVRLYADNSLVGDHTGSGVGTYVIDDDTTVVGLECASTGDGAILAEVGDNYFTDSTWLCTNRFYQHWSSAGYLFGDDEWWSAKALGDNSGSTFAQRSEIESDVKWIWTENSPADTRVYCRGYVTGERIFRIHNFKFTWIMDLPSTILM